MDGYGNDTTASDSSGGGSTAQALAQIFSTGVTAYVDSQAIQNGYQINNPQYFQSGYPAGVGATYTPTSAGQGASAQAGVSSRTLLLVVIAGTVLFFALKK